MSVEKLRQCDCCGGFFSGKDFPETSEIMVCYSCGRSSGFERRLHQLEAENQRLCEALEEVCNPIKFMERRLNENERLNALGAVLLAGSVPYLQSIASKALEAK